jgi:hypothetical protein
LGNAIASREKPNLPATCDPITWVNTVLTSFEIDSGKAKLYYSRDQDGFMCHRLEGRDRDLAMVLMALPKIPLVRSTGQLWWDYLPISTVTNGFRQALYQFGSAFFPRLASARYAGQWHSASTLKGMITIPGIGQKLQTAVSFDLAHQLVEINVGDRALVRDMSLM